MRRQGGKVNGGLFDPIYKEKVTSGHEKRGSHRMIIQLLGHLVFGMVIKDKDLLRYAGYCAN